MRLERHATTIALISLSVGFGGSAHAYPCDDLELPNPIYGSGLSTISATFAGLASALASLPEPITLLYADQGGACAGYGWFADNAITGVFKYWDAEGTQYTCDPPVSGQAADFAYLGAPLTSCEGQSLPVGVAEFSGPIHSLSVITDKDSPQKSISREALYFILGFGADSPNSEVSPWTTLNHIQVQRPTSFLSLLLAEAIGVPSNAFVPSANPIDSSTIVAIVADGETSPESTLGYVSSAAADKARAMIKTLAYQHSGQTCGYWPDSSEAALDKLSVRYGRYQLWTAGHFFTRVDPNGKIVNPSVEKILGWLRSSLPAPEGVDIPELVASAGDIPNCAMHVERAGFLGELSSYVSPIPCDCAFDVATGGGTDCTPCSDDSACELDPFRPFCRYGYCEAY